jgi:hypothetical protein
MTDRTKTTCPPIFDLEGIKIKVVKGVRGKPVKYGR